MPIIKREKTVLSYFQNLIAVAAFNQNFQMDESLRFYLANLLSTYLRTENLYPPYIKSSDEPLAIILKKASEAEKRTKYKLLKHVGDISLYTAGFFSDSLNRKAVGIDYYVSIGRVAYDTLAYDLITATIFPVPNEVFIKLSKNFPNYVKLLNEVSERTAVTSNSDIIKLYERWLRTGCERVAKILRKLGIYPNSKIKTHIEH